MPYVLRDSSGRIKSMFKVSPVGQKADFVAADDPEVLSFLTGDDSMLSLDLGFIRVIEDVIDILVEKGVIMYTDLPAAVQSKLNQRRSARQAQEPTLFDDDYIRL